MSEKKHVVFIHGMFVTNDCWKGWMEWFTKQNFICHAPAWPTKDKSVEQLRKEHPDPEIAKLTLGKIVDQYETFIKTLSAKPILIGHSMGGLITQLLVQRGLAHCGVAIDSAPPKGVITTKFSFLKSNWKAISPFASKNSPYMMSLETFCYTFANGFEPALQKRIYDHVVVPESRRVATAALTKAAKIDFNKPHAPLLFIAGSEDHIIPSSLNQTNYKKYSDQGSIKHFKEFQGRTHFIIAQEGWEQVAAYVCDWVERN